MTLPQSARRVTIVVLRAGPTDPAAADDWNRPVRTDATGDAPEVLRTMGDLQPRRARGGLGEVSVTTLAGTDFGSHVAFTDVLDIRTGDKLRLEPDDGKRYDVTRVDRPGIGRRLDHLEVGCDLVTSGVVALV